MVFVLHKRILEIVQDYLDTLLTWLCVCYGKKSKVMECRIVKLSPRILTSSVACRQVDVRALIIRASIIEMMQISLVQHLNLGGEVLVLATFAEGNA